MKNGFLYRNEKGSFSVPEKEVSLLVEGPKRSVIQSAFCKALTLQMYTVIQK